MTYGGGAYYGTFTDCTISNNTASGGLAPMGGGGYNSTLINCVVAGNSATSTLGYTTYGGGASSGKLFNCTIVNNTANSGGGTYSGTLVNCIVWGNTTPTGGTSNNSGGTFTYSCVSPKPTGAGNISSDPLFVDPQNGDFRLRTNSPCIDAGNTSANTTLTDLRGNPRVFGAAIDIGACEYAPFTMLANNAIELPGKDGNIYATADNIRIIPSPATPTPDMDSRGNVIVPDAGRVTDTNGNPLFDADGLLIPVIPGTLVIPNGILVIPGLSSDRAVVNADNTITIPPGGKVYYWPAGESMTLPNGGLLDPLTGVIVLNPDLPDPPRITGIHVTDDFIHIRVSNLVHGLSYAIHGATTPDRSRFIPCEHEPYTHDAKTNPSGEHTFDVTHPRTPAHFFHALILK